MCKEDVQEHQGLSNGHSKLATRFESSTVFCLGHLVPRGSQDRGELGAADSHVLPVES